MKKDPRTFPLEPDPTQEDSPNLGITLTIYQLLLLFQTSNLARTEGLSEVVRMSHYMALSPTHHLCGTSCSETDWLERAQARALERLGLVMTNQENTRWTLTEKGIEAVRLFRGIVISQLPEA